MNFSETQLEHFATLLHEEKDKVDEELSQVKASSSDFGNDIDGFDEEADEFEEIGNTLSVKEALQERRNRIEKALQKIKERKYGVCESCGKQIEEKLLLIDPESELCKECKISGKI